MKKIKTLVFVGLIFALGFIYNCTNDVTPSLTLQQKAAKILDEAGSWGGAGNVEVLASPSGVDFTALLGMQVAFNSSGADDWAPTFFVAVGADDFLSTDDATWVWTGSGTDNITLTEASVSELTSVDVTEDAVTFTFEVNPAAGGRVSGIDGSYTVKMSKKSS